MPGTLQVLAKRSSVASSSAHIREEKKDGLDDGEDGDCGADRRPPLLSTTRRPDEAEEDDDALFAGASPSSEASVAPCLQEACRGVQELLRQMVSKDDPSGGDEPGGLAGAAPSSSSAVRHRSAAPAQQQHQPQPASPTSTDLSPTASSFDTDTSSLAGFLADYTAYSSGTDHHHTSYNPATAAETTTTGNVGLIKTAASPLSSSLSPQGGGDGCAYAPPPHLAAAHRLGHLPLVQLCGWTLEQVQGEAPVLISPHPQGLRLANDNKSFPATSIGATTNANPGNQQSPNDRSDVSASAQATQSLSASTPRRFTMFASEYARHLSTTSTLAAAHPTTGKKPHHHQNKLKKRGFSSSSAANNLNASPSNHKPPKPQKSSRGSKASAAAAAKKAIPLLHEAEPSVQSGAVLDLVVTTGDNHPPPGYFRILPSIATSSSSSSSGGKSQQAVYLNCKKETNWDKAAQRPVITSLAVLQTPLDFVPPGYCVVKHADTKLPAKMGNAHLVFKRSREGNPVTDVLWLQPPTGIPTGYTVVERTPRNHVAKVGSDSNFYFVAYRQRLANLEALRPLPLIRAAQPKAGADFVDNDDDDCYHGGSGDANFDDEKLHAYYATGATTVSSAVGRYHILDRSTHRLQSPSSVQHRLALVQLSRTAARASSSSASTSNHHPNNADDAQSLSSTHLWAQALEDELDREPPPYGYDTDPEHEHDSGTPHGGGSTVPVTMLRHFFKLSLEPPLAGHTSSAASSSQHGGGGMMVQQCWNALSFIPAVETCGSAWLLQERMVVLTPILTACYIRHGGAAHVAVQELTQLLTTDFFADDLVPPDGDRKIPHLTLLDLALQAVCDVATTSCGEAQLAHCVDFVQGAMALSQGYLSSRSLGYVLRFYLFVFYFGASTCPNQSWPNPKWQHTHQPTVAIRMDAVSLATMLSSTLEYGVLTDPRDDANKYLPGGAPQAAALALKEYLHVLLVRLGQTCVIQTHHPEPPRDVPEHEEIGVFAGTILSGLVETAVEHVERANYTQLAYYQIHRSGGSELFWHDMITTCAPGLFRHDPHGIYAVTFSVLANLVKVALGKVRTDRSLLHSRDVASKLLSLELLLYFLELYADEHEALEAGGTRERYNSELVFSIRRMVVPCLLSNTRSGLEDPQVFSRILRIVSELWLSPVYRQQCKVELGILMEHFALRLLQMKPQIVATSQLDLWSKAAETSLLAQQVEVIQEIKKWCTDPKDTIELFLNFDTDICMTGPVQIVPGTRWKLFQRLCTSLTYIAEQCGEQIGRQIQESRNLEHHQTTAVEHGDAMRLLRAISLETISQIVKSLAVAAAASSGTDKFSKLLLSWTPCESPLTVSPTKSSKQNGDDQVMRYWRDAIAAKQQERLSSVVPTQQESRQVALEIAKRKNLKKAIEYMIACNSLSPSPRDVANFLRLHKDELDPDSLGEYLSESGVGVETEWWKSMRHLYVRAISFVGMQVEEGLRHFLTNCGFRLPGEAQRIDRIMSTFAKCYFEDNAGDSQRCPFKYEDTVYLISFAIIMLNTDLHKPSRKKMTKSEFINNLRGVEQGEDIPKEYLVQIYESIESKPIAMDHDSAHATEEYKSSIHGMLHNVRSADTLLRGLAVHDFQFATIDDFCDGLEYSPEDALADLTRCCVSQTWHQWYGVINTGLETAHLDPLGMGPSLEILLYALALTVCLDMPTERAAFLSQLGRLKAFEERRQGRYVNAGEPDGSVGEWFQKLEKACCGSVDRKLAALQEIRDWTVSVKQALLQDAQNKITMQAVVRQLKDGDNLLQDPARSFLRAGTLIKKSSRTGRSISYRFYLFSDVLLYAKEDADGRFNVHEELPLHLLKVVDWFPPSHKHRKVVFEVSHPRKSFTVVCPNAKERKAWVRDIKGAVQREMERKALLEAARVAATR